jgi:hypothetical protein
MLIRHLLSGGAKDNAWQHGMMILTPFEKNAWTRLETLHRLKDYEIQSNGYTVSTVEAGVLVL